MKYVAVFIGGGIGSACRLLLSTFVMDISKSAFPAGTFAVNLLGCFIIGIFSGISEKFIIPPNLRIFMFTGLMGGFTTFSSFGLETMKLIQGQEYYFTALNVFSSNIIGISLVFSGSALTRLILSNIK